MRTVVVKIGGSPEIDREAVLADVVALRVTAVPVVVVHGGGHQIDRLMAELRRAPRRATFPGGATGRLTDAETLDALQLALAGRVRPGIVGTLAAAGQPAVGLSGLDGGIVQARRKTALKVVEDGRRRVVRDDLSGTITGVDPAVLSTLLASGCTPVLSPPADGGADGPLNVDADHLAAAVAVALGASALVFLSDTAGLLRDVTDPGSWQPHLTTSQLDAYGAGGRMRQKLRAARTAALGGVGLVVLGDGRRAEPLHAALAGRGTVVWPDARPTVNKRDAPQCS
jgi:acetylglutamate/LysW-gamma-L-alpha-aminoadipate kinase